MTARMLRFHTRNECVRRHPSGWSQCKGMSPRTQMTTGNSRPAEPEMGQHHAIYHQESPAAYVLLVTAGKLQAATDCTAHVQHCNHGIHHHILNYSAVWLCNIAL